MATREWRPAIHNAAPRGRSGNALNAVSPVASMLVVITIAAARPAIAHLRCRLMDAPHCHYARGEPALTVRGRAVLVWSEAPRVARARPRGPEREVVFHRLIEPAIAAI